MSAQDCVHYFPFHGDYVKLSFLPEDSSSNVPDKSWKAFKRSPFSNARYVINSSWPPFRKAPLQRILYILAYQMIIFLRLIEAATRPFTIIGVVLVEIAVYLCLKYQWVVNFHPTLLIGIVVFPLSFSINMASTRRERALDEQAVMSGSLATLISNTVQWSHCQRVFRPAAYVTAVCALVHQLSCSAAAYLRVPAEQRPAALARFYVTVARLFSLVDVIRWGGDVAHPISTRSNQALQIYLVAFERLRNIRDYRSPIVVRFFSMIVAHVVPILLAPSYVWLAQFRNPAMPPGGDWGAYYMGGSVAFIFCWLTHILDHLEVPFSSDDDGISRFAQSMAWPSVSMPSMLYGGGGAFGAFTEADLYKAEDRSREAIAAVTLRRLVNEWVNDPAAWASDSAVDGLPEVERLFQGFQRGYGLKDLLLETFVPNHGPGTARKNPFADFGQLDVPAAGRENHQDLGQHGPGAPYDVPGARGGLVAAETWVPGCVSALMEERHAASPNAAVSSREYGPPRVP